MYCTVLYCTVLYCTVLVLYLQRGVGPLPQPLSAPCAAEVSTRRLLLREAEEVEAEAVLWDVLDGEQPHAQLGPVQVQALLHTHKALESRCGCNGLLM